jgi:hypothetical protein
MIQSGIGEWSEQEVPKHTSAKPFCEGSIGGLPRFPVRNRRRSSEFEGHRSLSPGTPDSPLESVSGIDEFEDIAIIYGHTNKNDLM